MKKWLGYILSLYILFSTIVPCSFFDDCEEEDQTEQAAEHEKKECSNCSPFSSCSLTPVFTMNGAVSLEPLLTYHQRHYGELYQSPASGYYSAFFQPPRFC